MKPLGGIVLVLTLLLPGHVLAQADPLLCNRLREAAYFGEVGELAAGLDTLRQSKPICESPQSFARYAVSGRQPAVIELLAARGEIRDFKWVFELEDMNAEMASVLIRSTPNFKEQAHFALAGAVKSMNLEVVRILIKAGAPVSDPKETVLHWAVSNRDRRVIEALLAAGADPYAGRTGQRAVDVALAMRSAPLLALVDTKGEYARQLAELKRNAPPAGSPFVGFWSTGNERGLSLSDDGSGIGINSAGLWPFAWRQDGDVANVFSNPAGPSGAPSDSDVPVMRLRLVDQNTLEMLPPSEQLAGSPKPHQAEVKRISHEPMSMRPSSQSLHPVFVRLERAWLTPDETLVLQINGRHLSVPVAQLVECAARSKKSSPAFCESNVLEWSRFRKNDGIKKAASRWRGIPVDRSTVSSGRYEYWEGLSFGRERVVSSPPDTTEGLVSLPPDATMGLFKLSSSSMDLFRYALVAAKPFPHGADWVPLWIRRSEENK